MDYFNIVYAWIIIGLLSFPFILKFDAPYGRHSSSKWGYSIDNKLAWIVMELPALLVCPLIFYLSTNEKSILTSFFIFLWLVHYFNRTIIYPNRILTKKKKMPLIIAMLAFIFNLVNGYINGYYFGFIDFSYSLEWVYTPQFIIGSILFIVGFLINTSSDSILINLRKKNTNEYTIPRKGLFNYISCPNFFGEIIEWLGFAVMTWSIAGLAFFLWTFFNLVPRALSHHTWYKNTFSDYPKNRKAVFPFII
jgi:3-oxo-5-alpha-steroid 4-dehydrogenase 1